MVHINIAMKEMVPIVIAMAIWGHEWQDSTILAKSDNMAVVLALTKGTAKHPLLMHLIHCLHFFSARRNISMIAMHIAGVLNTAADALSCNQLSAFLLSTPQAAKEPCHVPESLVEMLIQQGPDWTVAAWRRMFLSSSTMH